MVSLTVDAAVRIEGGPNFVMRNNVSSRTFSVAKFELVPTVTKENGTATIKPASNEIPLVPPKTRPVLLGIRVHNPDGTAGTVNVVAKHYPATDEPTSASSVAVTGSLVIVSSDLLRLWVKDGPNAFEFTTVAPTVDVAPTEDTARLPIAVDLVVAMDADDEPGNGHDPDPPGEQPEP